MYRVLSCLVAEHNNWLVLLAVLVCIATTLTSFLMYSIAEACGRSKLLWAAVTGVSAGSGIWATHFVAMLAYKGALPT
jgi:diguanylate cyclase